ncbi:MAG: VOC family protein [Burkholderiaceae bacterium]|nr:VOC family protein [Microbacteriaceae bacterium]
MGAVTLLVGDLDGMTTYYRDAVGLVVLSAIDDTVTLGRGSTPLVVLERHPELTNAAHGTAGLFHTAILFDTQAGLAAALYSVATHAPGSFTGSADHLVSQAFYFDDPEGNGVELYWDRDRTLWSWAHGQVEMASLHLDPNEFLREHLAENPHFGDAVIGHVHLAVGDIASAREFYVDRLGFEATAEFGPQALFVSAGGYHHHMAMNTWGSTGAGPRTRALGLGQVNIVVPTADDLGALGERLTHYEVGLRHNGRVVSFGDPWNNIIRVTATA